MDYTKRIRSISNSINYTVNYIFVYFIQVFLILNVM